MQVPSRLKAYPDGITKLTIDFRQPNSFILFNIFGNTTSEDEEPNTINISDLIWFNNLKIFQNQQSS